MRHSTSQAMQPTLQPSLLDRLMDQAPEQQGEDAGTLPFSADAMRESIRRDLENLLNAKLHWDTWPACYSELDRSLLRYGLPDFSSMPLGNLEGRQALCDIIEQTIRTFEPRFQDVAVSVVEQAQPLDRTLRLRIQALLNIEPLAAEALTFDSEVEPVSLALRVRDASV